MRILEVSDDRIRQDRVELAVAALRSGGVVALATDAAWAFVADPQQAAALQKLLRLRGPSAKGDEKPASVLCHDIATLGSLAVLSQPMFRTLRRLVPGPYTLVVPASRDVPKPLLSKRRTVGARLPIHPVTLAVLEQFGGPLAAITARGPDGERADASSALRDWPSNAFDVLLDSDPIEVTQTTVLDCTGDEPTVLRLGAGAVDANWEVAAVDEPGAVQHERDRSGRLRRR